jgi:hypothetical protein
MRLPRRILDSSSPSHGYSPDNSLVAHQTLNGGGGGGGGG